MENLGIDIKQERISNVEWVFQFDNDEPVFLLEPIDSKTKKLEFTISNLTGSNIHFKDGKGKEFKIFAREKNVK